MALLRGAPNTHHEVGASSAGNLSLTSYFNQLQ
jgi:hypothetical protein